MCSPSPSGVESFEGVIFSTNSICPLNVIMLVMLDSLLTHQLVIPRCLRYFPACPISRCWLTDLLVEVISNTPGQEYVYLGTVLAILKSNYTTFHL